MNSLDPLAHPPAVTLEAWRAARLDLLAAEKALTRERDRVNAARRRLPMVKVQKPYVFDGPDGKVGLKDLFGGRRQLVVYHFMFAPDWEKGCPSCTWYVGTLGDLAMLTSRDTAFSLVSRAPYPKLDAYRKARGWTVPWVSSGESDFNYDFHATIDETRAPFEYNYRNRDEAAAIEGGPPQPGERHGLSVFFRLGDDVFHTYSTYARGTEAWGDARALLDLTPYGRQEDFEESPAGWPQQPTYGARTY